ncbi:MAG TPA: polyphosphate kinase 1 [Candidatus Binatia bacterium]|nr:polyphosphate kinase 1 [Candidatus Binatia bacterium]
MPNDTTAGEELKNPSYYINRELSHISFNERVLNEAFNEQQPLLERVKFLSITASNMDEFFMVRVSGLKQQVLLGINDRPPDGLLPREQLVAINRSATALLERKMLAWHELHQELCDAGIRVQNHSELKPRRQERLRDYFETEIFPVLTPLALDPGRPFPHISNLSINLAVVIRDPLSGETRFARVKVPSTLPRLVPLKPMDPDDLLTPAIQKFVWVEQIIAANLDRLFPGMEIVTAHTFRVTRNTDMEIQEEEADDLLLTIEESLRRRHFGFVVRLEIDETMPDWIRDILVSNLQIGQNDVYIVDGPVGLSSLMQLHRLERPDLKDDYFVPAMPPPLRTADSIFNILKRQDVLLHRPYDSFVPVIDFIQAAAEDPDVLAIKMTLYRVGPDPPVVHALMRARENGKQVAVLVELKARFDEESNIEWARALEKAGVHVAYGLIGLKTHCKVCLVVRRERDGIQRYVHLSTGNYNAATARVYGDLDFLTVDEDLCADATELFNYLTGYSKQENYRKFIVAPVTFRDRVLSFINREIEYGAEGRIIIKLNALVDAAMVRAFYRASRAGVKIDLIVRGICCLRPGLEGLSENIRVLSIVGRFLEHGRIYYFRNGGEPLLYVGSADLMPRNIDRRVEILFPVQDPLLRQEIIENILNVQLRDDAKGYWLQKDGTYEREVALTLHDNGQEHRFDSQAWFLNGRTTLLQPQMPEVGD